MTIIEANGVELGMETFGDPGDPAILLVHGASASMLWWEAELCARIAAQGRFVIRYDNRDTGVSVSYPPGRLGYSLRDLAGDAIGILDALDVRSAHLVGRSMAGAIVTFAALAQPERVKSLTLVSTTSGAPDLPPMSDEFSAYVADGADPADHDAVVEYVVGLMRVYSGGSPYFDESAVRAIAEEDVIRTRDGAACLANHFAMKFDAPPGGLDDLRVPTLVVHGENDPVFPLPHGEALRDAIPGAELLVLDKAGHELPPPLWDTFVAALVWHTENAQLRDRKV